jgi:hypothetical protein
MKMWCEFYGSSELLDRQQIASQWGLQLIFRMHNRDPTPQGVENRNILLWFKCVLTALHVNCIRSRSFITTLFHSSVHFFPVLVKGLYQTESYSLHVMQLIRI